MSEALTADQLKVTWHLPHPPVSASSWKIWQPQIKPAAHSLDKDLGWPSGTVNILEMAFQEQLGRTVGWDLRNLRVP
jgi:hypothetical protein